MPPFALTLLLATALDHQPVLWLDVPFIRQVENGCGAACIVMVLRYWQPSAPAEEPQAVFRSLFEPKSNGIPAVRMEGYFRRQGYHVYAFRGRWDDLAHHLAKGRPLIAALRRGKSEPAHYVVVAGIDTVRDLVQLNDPARVKLRSMRRNDFEREWRECDYWTLLALPPDES